jgi:predicted nucleotide-binding protein
MRGLAWDDVPKDVERIKKALQNLKIDLEIEKDVEQFGSRLMTEDWDFVITDLVDDRAPNVEIKKSAGVANARKAARRVRAVFIVTGYADRVNLHDLDLPANVYMKSKNLEPVWMASEIRDTLDELGLLINHNEVFLIYGRDRGVRDAKGIVRTELMNYNLNVLMGNATTLKSTIPQDLLKMMKSCGAFVAICTPDDELSDGTNAPRGNVLYEMGMAVGLAGGLDRLVILQKWGKNSVDRAVLPSDFGGNVPLRFKRKISETFPDLQARLKDLRVLP